MGILKSFFIAFSIYSKIPVPQFDWKEEDMKYMLCFFPWIGTVIGVCLGCWRYLCGTLGVGEVCYVLVGAALPLLITGGFHVDGFMDTMDAFHSYQPKEKKLEILKDSHIGAFAVIMLLTYGLIYLGAFSEIKEDGLFGSVCGGFFLSRCLSGIAVVSFPAAKKEGSLSLFAESSKKKVVKWALYLQGGACVGFMLWQAMEGIWLVLAAILAFVYYYGRCKKEFGGITGDTAGYFVVVCEGCIMVVAAVIHLFLAEGLI